MTMLAIGRFFGALLELTILVASVGVMIGAVVVVVSLIVGA